MLFAFASSLVYGIGPREAYLSRAAQRGAARRGAARCGVRPILALRTSKN